jgi:DNA-binding transcriptional MerR regulator
VGGVPAGYKIKEVSERSGFSAPTLRYYEEIGILPEPARTASGYRTYDDSTLARLAFIARAKQLGCTLDEIADLTTAWEGGRCGPIQDRLRSLVADKLADSQRRLGELITLSSELQQAAALLERHRPEGACDDLCGCLSVEAAEQTLRVALISKPDENETPIACTLAPESLSGRMDDWSTLLAHATTRVAIAGGVRVGLDTDTPTDELMRVVGAEQDCCQFFRFAITIDARGLALEVTAPEDALPIVHLLFGAAA